MSDVLFSNQTANADSVSFKPSIGSLVNYNNKAYLQINGTLDDASITLQVKDPDGNWHSTGRSDEVALITDTPGVFIIDYSDELELRVAISNVGGSTSLSIWLKNGALI